MPRFRRGDGARHGWKTCAVALGAAALFALLHVAADVAWLRRAETATLDWRLRLRGPRPAGPEVVIVQIGERAVRELGRWPLPRKSFAELVYRLDRAGARVIALDILFAEPEPAPSP